MMNLVSRPSYALLFLIFFCLVGINSQAFSSCRGRDPGTPFFDVDNIVDRIRIRQLSQSRRPRKAVKVAIFDKGFAGFDPQKQNDCSLPKNTRFYPLPGTDLGDDPHGFEVARAYYQVLTNNLENKEFEPESLLLFNVFKTNARTNLKNAVDAVIEADVSIVIIAQVYELGGNFDGGGPFNELISKMANAGILVLNSSGNSGQTTFNGPIVGNRDALHPTYAPLLGSSQTLMGVCEPDRAENVCTVNVTLAWNAADKDPLKGTDKDLDLYVFQAEVPPPHLYGYEQGINEQYQEAIEDLFEQFLTGDIPARQRRRGAQVAGVFRKSVFRQATAQRALTEEELRAGSTISLVPAERINNVVVNKGPFFIRVKKVSRYFNNRDQLRVTLVSNQNVRLVGADKKESLPVLADNPNVVTVGALEGDEIDPTSAVSYELRKPEVYAPSSVERHNEVLSRSTIAVAVTGAAATAMVTLNEKLGSRVSFLEAINYGNREEPVLDLNPRDRRQQQREGRGQRRDHQGQPGFGQPNFGQPGFNQPRFDQPGFNDRQFPHHPDWRQGDRRFPQWPDQRNQPHPQFRPYSPWPGIGQLPPVPPWPGAPPHAYQPGHPQGGYQREQDDRTQDAASRNSSLPPWAYELLLPSPQPAAN